MCSECRHITSPISISLSFQIPYFQMSSDESEFVVGDILHHRLFEKLVEQTCGGRCRFLPETIQDDKSTHPKYGYLVGFFFQLQLKESVSRSTGWGSPKKSAHGSPKICCRMWNCWSDTRGNTDCLLKWRRSTGSTARKRGGIWQLLLKEYCNPGKSSTCSRKKRENGGLKEHCLQRTRSRRRIRKRWNRHIS